MFNIYYKYCGYDDDDDVCGIETHDNWVMIELWDVGDWDPGQLGHDWVMRCGILEV